MSQIRILICRVDENNPEQMTELASYDLPRIDTGTLDREITLDETEATLHKQGQALLKRALQAQFEEMDRELVEAYRQDFPPSGGSERWIFDGEGSQPFWASGIESSGIEP